MEAEDTVMGNKKLQLLGQQYEDDLPTYDLNHYLLLAQAEISFFKGEEQGVRVGLQLGMKKIVDWTAREYGVEWEEEQLKEWGLK